MIEDKKNILVVEDDTETVELFSEMLKLGGYLVQVCFDGKQAIKIIDDNPPDVIVLDMMMPVSSGMDVLKHLHANVNLSIPVVVVSAKGLPGDIEDAVEAGAAYYLRKPVSYLDLKEAVEKALKNR